jgi:hypothetical protein
LDLPDLRQPIDFHQRHPSEVAAAAHDRGVSARRQRLEDRGLQVGQSRKTGLTLAGTTRVPLIRFGLVPAWVESLSRIQFSLAFGLIEFLNFFEMVFHHRQCVLDKLFQIRVLYLFVGLFEFCDVLLVIRHHGRHICLVESRAR